MNWQEVCEDPSLQNLHFKIELDQWGRIIMSPASNDHGAYQYKVSSYLDAKLNELGGRVITECAIQTRLGVRVADVAWASPDFTEEHQGEIAFSTAPEICIEVQSPGNTNEEMEEKKLLYFEQGALEYWLCSLQGDVQFFVPEGPTPVSKQVPDFPQKVDLNAKPYSEELLMAKIEAQEERQAKDAERQAKEEAQAEVARLLDLLNQKNEH